MDDNTKQIAIQKITNIQAHLRVAKKMLVKDEKLEVVVDGLTDLRELISELKSFLKVYSIVEKVNKGKHEEAIKEFNRFY